MRMYLIVNSNKLVCGVQFRSPALRVTNQLLCNSFFMLKCTYMRVIMYIYLLYVNVNEKVFLFLIDNVM